MVAQQPLDVDGFQYYPRMGLFHGRWNLHLTPGEAKVCAALMLRPGHVVSIDGIMQFVGTEANSDRIVSHWISLARQKIRKHCRLEPIQTSIGYGGYFWQLEEESGAPS